MGSEAEANALREHYDRAEDRYRSEVERLIDERKLSPTVEEVAERLAAYLTEERAEAVGVD